MADIPQVGVVQGDLEQQQDLLLRQGQRLRLQLELAVLGHLLVLTEQVAVLQHLGLYHQQVAVAVVKVMLEHQKLE